MKPINTPEDYLNLTDEEKTALAMKALKAANKDQAKIMNK